MDIPLHPTVNATLNLIAAVLLWRGRVAIKAGDPERHRRIMMGAFGTSAVFLASYLTYHYTAEMTLYPHQDWRKTLYLLVLLPHIVLATVMVPFILAAVWHALKGRYDKHRRLVRWVWPVWMYVSVTGVIVYLMLYVIR
jgi:putative membrane protein